MVNDLPCAASHRITHDTPDCAKLDTQPQHAEKSSSNSNVLLSESPSLDAAGASVDPHPNPMSCFPTEERLRQKERLKKTKAAGEKPKARQVHVEEHFDDCGTDLTGLAPFIKTDSIKPADSQEEKLYHAIHVLDGFDSMELSEHTYQAENLESALHN